jgi:hypothetical protein
MDENGENGAGRELALLALLRYPSPNSSAAQRTFKIFCARRSKIL